MERICGIYKITNTVNGKVYIGQSVHIKQRWKNHKKDAFWENGPDYHYPLYKAIRKYGYDNFKFEIVEKCEKDELNQREQFYIQQYLSFQRKYGYNQTMGGDSQEHAKKLTDEDVDKIIIRLKTSYDSANIICKEFGVGATLVRDINRGDAYHRENETYPIRQKLYKLAGYFESQGRTAYSTSPVKVKRSYNAQKKKTSQNYVDICPLCGETKTIGAAMCSKCRVKKNRKDNPIANCPNAIELARLVAEHGFEATGRQFNVTGKTIVHWCKIHSLPTKKKDIANWYYIQANIILPEKPTHKKKSDIMKRVHQIDMTTHKIIATFDFPLSAAKSISDKADSTHIAEVCRGKRKSAYGYFWQYADENNT